MSEEPLSLRLAGLAARTRAWAQARAVQTPQLPVRLAKPLQASAPLAKPLVDALLGLEKAHVGGAQPRPPYAPSLEAFQRQIADCQRCGLGHKRKKLVFGSGSANAALVLVGDAPNGKDDASGRPFSGEDGDLLDRILAAMGFKRSDVYLLQALKCQAQGRPEQEASWAEACKPYWAHQLALLKPKAVVSLGAFSTRVLLGSAKPLAELRGRWSEAQGLPLMPTYHPADLLKDPGLKRFVWDDMKLVIKKLQEA